METDDQPPIAVSTDSPESTQDIQVSPSGRFIRQGTDPIGVGAFKAVYKAIDTEDSIEVAWNQLRLDALTEFDIARLHKEVNILRSIRHPSIIGFNGHWFFPPGSTEPTHLVFITELMSSGTIRSFSKKVGRVNLRTVKRWCRQILSGLNYLHTQTPKIVHRDLKCDNIFINGSHGEVKIGDLGLSRRISKNMAESIAGTPEFMAPECFEGHFDERADIYSFGMCLLEMVTFEYPYAECNGAAAVWKKVFEGKPPKAFDEIKHSQLRAFIGSCIGPLEQRPSAIGLLRDPFLADLPTDKVVIFPPSAAPAIPVSDVSRFERLNEGERLDGSERVPLAEAEPQSIEGCASAPILSRVPSSSMLESAIPSPSFRGQVLDVEGVDAEDVSVTVAGTSEPHVIDVGLVIHPQDPAADDVTIRFAFDTACDTVGQVVTELIEQPVPGFDAALEGQIMEKLDNAIEKVQTTHPEPLPLTCPLPSPKGLGSDIDALSEELLQLGQGNTSGASSVCEGSFLSEHESKLQQKVVEAEALFSEARLDSLSRASSPVELNPFGSDSVPEADG